MDSANVYAVLTIMATFMLIPISLAVEGPSAMVKGFKIAFSTGRMGFMWQMILSGFFYYMYNEVAFLALGKLDPVSHAVCNTMKRVVIIITAIVVFRTPVTGLGVLGSSVAILGTLMYSLSKTKYAKPPGDFASLSPRLVEDFLRNLVPTPRNRITGYRSRSVHRSIDLTTSGFTFRTSMLHVGEDLEERWHSKSKGQTKPLLLTEKTLHCWGMVLTHTRLPWTRRSNFYERGLSMWRKRIPDFRGIGYKVVAKVGNRLLSIWAGDRTEYTLGVTIRDEAGPNHSGGLYVCRTQGAALRHRVPARRGGLFFAPRLLLRCRCEGPFVEYPGGKIACSALTPMDLQPVPLGYLHTSPQRAGAVPSPVAATFGPSEGLRVETSALEAEVAELERRLGYR
ncbi:GPT1 [Symbiodinium pilosum]|uniref:GPT1 protein n=1 Tax=Symbiodinium pilosum TaxID=2952 RepID=A0A812W2A3_SYMPI|nr:GPT1 [Symbiodinium pilosum]